jgi:hypothetical protein
MKGKCFGCRSSDHSKADGKHNGDICCHCKKKGHRSNVCFAKYMGKEAVATTRQADQQAVQSQGNSAQSTSTTQQAQSQPQATASASTSVHPLQKQIEEMCKQIKALKASF